MLKTILLLTMMLVAAASRAAAQDAGAPATVPAATASPVTYFDSKTMTEAFVKGKTLLSTPGYKVMTSRRTEPGQVEVHADETDVFYIVEGDATFVTGGTVVDPHEASPGQTRGTSINGGEIQQLHKGDVIVIPAGVPHWFKEVPGPFVYFVVKPITPPAASH